MALTASHLADKSALARLPLPSVRARVVPMLVEGLIATCPIVDLEVLFSARSHADYELLLEERRALPSVPIDEAVTDRAIDVQRRLARVARHRVPIPDLLLAAAAEQADLAVLHYDRDFEVIADVTGQPQEWVAPAGSLER